MRLEFEDGPLAGRSIADSSMTDRFIITSRDGGVCYYRRRYAEMTVPGSGHRVRVAVYGHVKDAETSKPVDQENDR